MPIRKSPEPTTPPARRARFYLLLAGLASTVVLLIATVFWLRHQLERAEVTEAALADRRLNTIGAWVETESRTPCANNYPLRKAWYGDLHVHTAASFDATAFGTLATADDAYRFARGMPHFLSLRGDSPDFPTPVVRLRQPLDFMAVTDHAEALGETRLCYDQGSNAWDSISCRAFRGDATLPLPERFQALLRLLSFASFGRDRAVRVCGEDGRECAEAADEAWRDNLRAAERWLDHSSDCAFTTFNAYEYSLAVESSNLHRNVIFRSTQVPQSIASAREAPTPELLWQWLDDVCVSGSVFCDVLTIPHNSNWSSGRMWVPYSWREDLDPRDRRRLTHLRARLEPLVEIYQTKGDSECRNGIASVVGEPDEFCDFEKLRPANEQIPDCGNEVGSGGMLLKGCESRNSYVRYALTSGLEERRRYGINPFQLGIIAGTDTHVGVPLAEFEANFHGSHGTDRDIQSRLLGGIDVPGGIARGSPVRYSPGGLTGVYAEQNTRESLFDALRRRETFGTSGTRIAPRFFAGWSLPANLCDRHDYLEVAYRDGVPMGGELFRPPLRPTRSPVFIASAILEEVPPREFLQRIQIIKGWQDSAGRTHQAVYDIVGTPDNGATVNTGNCRTVGVGDGQLCGSWRDPDFDPDIAAVYYARVLENPSCRWSQYDCLALDPEQRPRSCSDPELPATVQERAWTSPIWYYPN